MFEELDENELTNRFVGLCKDVQQASSDGSLPSLFEEGIKAWASRGSDMKIVNYPGACSGVVYSQSFSYLLRYLFTKGLFRRDYENLHFSITKKFWKLPEFEVLRWLKKLPIGPVFALR